MLGLRTIFAIIPVAEAAESAVAAFKALPVADRPRLIGVHVAPLALPVEEAKDALRSKIGEARRRQRRKVRVGEMRQDEHAGRVMERSLDFKRCR